MGVQDLVAISAVLLAAGYLASLVWRGVGAGGAAGGCSTSCGKCSTGGRDEPQGLVTIGGGPKP